jgi:hypothetical protein
MGKLDPPRIAILGGGPIGLEAALYACSLNYSVKLYERGRTGEHLSRWGHVRMFSPFGMNSTHLGRSSILAENPKHEFPAEGDCLTGRQHLTAYLEPLAKTSVLRDTVHVESRVLQVSRRGLLKADELGSPRRAQQPFRLLIRDSKNREYIEEAEIVLDCTGTYGQHRWMGGGGIPAPGELTAEQSIAYGLEDVLGQRQGVYAGKVVLVYGGGYSAATTVCNLAALGEQHPETWVVWLARGSSSQPIRRITNDPLRERDRLAVSANILATRADKNVEFHKQTVIESVESAGPDRGFRVSTSCAGKTRVWEADRLIANVGYSPDTILYRELQVHECYATLGPIALAAGLLKHAGADCLAIPALGAESLRNPEPNFFILGAKSFGRNSNFLMRQGFEQIRDVFALVTGKASLDLYRGKRA